VNVGTPVEGDHKADIEHLKKATMQIGKILKTRDTVILRSTVPVGTTRNILLPILEKESNLKGGEAFYLAFAPERTVAGKALEELRTLPQIIGGLNKRSLDVVSNLFSNLNTTIVRMSSLEAAEMIKLVNNAYRNVTFAFANELAIICDHWGIDPVNVINAANQGYSRNDIPVPSPGVGGPCLKKDPYIYIESVNNLSFKGGLSLCSRKINDYMSLFVFNKIDLFIKQNKRDQDIKIFVVGFAFKGEPETSDIRDSTTIDLVEIMKNKTDWHIFGYDPVVSKDNISRLGIVGCGLREGFKGADCILIMNNHRSYIDVDILGLLELMNKPAFFLDAWSLFPYNEIESVKGVFYGRLGGKD
jgi:UDP-N-acetyl-D-mannosaminuronic acid dehydrogenase